MTKLGHGANKDIETDPPSATNGFKCYMLEVKNTTLANLWNS